VAGTIQDIPTALCWLKETFFYLRAQQNPQHYGVSGCVDLDQTLQDLAMKAIAQLSKIKAVTYNHEDMSVVSTSNLSTVACRIRHPGCGLVICTAVLDTLCANHGLACLQARSSANK
jgi:hypothetical protein